MTAATRCDSCARDDEELVAVRRVYVTPAAWDQVGTRRVEDEVEHWCFPCRSHYPHEEVGQG